MKIKHIFTEEEDKYITDNYKSKTNIQIANDLKLTDAQVRHRMQRHLNIKPSKRRKHFPDESFFFKDSRELYYILGLIYADGNLYRDSLTHCKVSISLHSKDVDLLKQINSLFCDTNLVSTRRTSNMSELVLYNKVIYEKLELFGLTPNKSLITKFPENIPREYVPNFILGYFDGDGSITARTGRAGFYIQMLGTESFLSEMMKRIDEELCIGMQNVNNTNSKIKSIRYSTKKAKLLMDWLYSKNSLYLSRKYNKFKSFI